MPFVNAEKKKCPSVPRAIIATKLCLVLFTCFPTRQNTNSGQKRCCCSCKILASCFSIVLERSRMYNNPSKEKKMPQWRNSQSSSVLTKYTLNLQAPGPHQRVDIQPSPIINNQTKIHQPLSPAEPLRGPAADPQPRLRVWTPQLGQQLVVGCGGGKWRGRSHPYECLLESHIHHDD